MIRIYTLDLDTNMLKTRGWKKIFHKNSNQMKATLISNKTDFKF